MSSIFCSFGSFELTISGPASALLTRLELSTTIVSGLFKSHQKSTLIARLKFKRVFKRSTLLTSLLSFPEQISRSFDKQWLPFFALTSRETWVRWGAVHVPIRTLFRNAAQSGSITLIDYMIEAYPQFYRSDDTFWEAHLVEMVRSGNVACLQHYLPKRVNFMSHIAYLHANLRHDTLLTNAGASGKMDMVELVTKECRFFYS